MKRRILTTTEQLLVALVAVVMTAVTSATAGEIRHTLTLDPTELKADSIIADDGNAYLYLTIPGLTYTGECGEARIPCRQLSFLVPAYSNNFSISIENAICGEEYETDLPFYRNRKEDDDKDEKVNLAGLPAEEVALQAEPRILSDYFVNGDKHIVSVAIPVVRIGDMVSPLLSADVVLSYSECEAGKMDAVPLSVPQSEFDIDLSGTVVNWPGAAKMSPERVVSYVESKRYCYILVPESLRDAINDMVAWKIQKGLSVVVKTVEEIEEDETYAVFTNGGVTSVAVDKESHIRNFLRSEYSRIGAFELLLVGNDFTSAPVRKFYKGNPEDAALETFASPSFIYSDLYFSDMNTEFKLTKIPEGQYTTRYDGFSFNPTLPTGRLLVRDSKEIDTYFKKFLIYQLDPGLGDTSYLDTSLFVKGNDMIFWDNEWYLDNKSVTECIPGLKSIVYRDTVAPTEYSLCFPKGKNVIDDMRNCGLISLQGHGSPYSIEVSGKHTIGLNNNNWKNCPYIQPLSSSPMTKEWGFKYEEDGNAYDDLKNYGKPSVLYTSACSTSPYGRIDHEDGYKNVYYNMSTAYLFAGDFGGVAFIGTSVDCPIKENNKEEYNFGTHLNANCNLAQCLVNSKTTTTFSKIQPSQLARNLHGDPDIDVWTHGAPTEQQTYMTTDFSSVSFSGEGTSGAKIAFYDGMEQSRTFNIILVSAPFSILKKENWNFIRDRDFMVSIFRQDKLPCLKLFASDSNLKNVSKRYFLRDGVIEDCLGQGKFAFNVGSNGRLEISATRKIETSKALHVNEGGNVILSSLSTAELAADCVDKDGELSVEAASVTLKSGFEVKKGGVLSISVNNNK